MALRFLIDEGVVVILKSSMLERMVESCIVIGFALTNEDREQNRSLDGGKSIVLPHGGLPKWGTLVVGNNGESLTETALCNCYEGRHALLQLRDPQK